MCKTLTLTTVSFLTSKQWHWSWSKIPKDVYNTHVVQCFLTGAKWWRNVPEMFHTCTVPQEGCVRSPQRCWSREREGENFGQLPGKACPDQPTKRPSREEEEEEEMSAWWEGGRQEDCKSLGKWGEASTEVRASPSFLPSSLASVCLSSLRWPPVCPLSSSPLSSLCKAILFPYSSSWCYHHHHPSSRVANWHRRSLQGQKSDGHLSFRLDMQQFVPQCGISKEKGLAYFTRKKNVKCLSWVGVGNPVSSLLGTLSRDFEFPASFARELGGMEISLKCTSLLQFAAPRFFPLLLLLPTFLAYIIPSWKRKKKQVQ